MEVEIVPRTFHISSRLVSLVVRVQRLKRKKKKKKKIKNRNGVYFLPAEKVHLWCTRWDADAYRKSLLCAVFAIIWNIEISFWKGVFSFSDGKKKKKNERKIVPSIPPFKFKRGFKFQIVPRERISEIRNSTMECEFRPCFVLIAIGTPVSLNRERRRRNDKRGTQGFRTCDVCTVYYADAGSCEYRALFLIHLPRASRANGTNATWNANRHEWQRCLANKTGRSLTA